MQDLVAGVLIRVPTYLAILLLLKGLEIARGGGSAIGSVTAAMVPR
jgi:hypothetical protein